MKKLIRYIKPLLIAVTIVICLPMAGQAPAYEELEFEPDSTKGSYKPAGKNYVILKSKRGSSGMAKTASGDALASSEVTEIVLVYTETEASDLAEREDANRERWENLLKTYPELFQFSTTYKSLCQCKMGGDAEALKASQGFYVYVNGDVPKVAEEPKAAEPPPAAKPKVEETPPAKTTKVEEKKPIAAKEVAVASTTSVKVKDPPPAETPVETKKAETPVPAKKAETPVETKVTETPIVAKTQPEAAAEPEEEVVAKPAAKKKTAANKPRRAKDAKACRPACYGFGDEDLYLFFKDNFPLTKKEKRKAKNWMAQVRLQINFDGSIKKTMVTGSEEAFNQKIQEVIKSMNNWNAAVKGGVAVKSEVRFTLKYDKPSKSIKPFDMIMNPKASPKCPCVSDSEIFAD